MKVSRRIVRVGLTLSAFSVAAAISAQAPADLHGRALTAAGGPAPDTVVWIDAPNATSASPPARRIVLDQRNLAFSPHVLVVRVGTVVDFPNNDRVFHNVFSFRDGKKFDLGMYPVGTLRQVTFDRAGLSRIFCNIHPGMAAYVIAVDSPYFARADSNGAFAIPEIPPGQHTYHAWRPGAAANLTGTWSPASGPLTVTW
jgi:plastocyanin